MMKTIETSEMARIVSQITEPVLGITARRLGFTEAALEKLLPCLNERFAEVAQHYLG